MSAAESQLAGAAPGDTPHWHSSNWNKVRRTVRRLQARIVKAVQAGKWHKVQALVYLLDSGEKRRYTHNNYPYMIPASAQEVR
jgi:hypothetical protein